MPSVSFTNLRLVIFSDLDGTLLHPETYSFEEAAPALDIIRKRKIPLVFCSSKTKSELAHYLERLNIYHPFVFENGGGIFIPKGYFSGQYAEYEPLDDVIVLGTRYEKIRKAFTEIREQFGIPVRGFGDMSAEEVAELTGLTLYEAKLARQRDFSEPFLFARGADERFLGAIREIGYTWTRGRLYCLMGQHDKGKAVKIVKRLYEKEHGKIISIGLGDAMNDLQLLQEVDLPVLVQKNNGSYETEISVHGLIRAPGVGPDGWNKVLLELLK